MPKTQKFRYDTSGKDQGELRKSLKKSVILHCILAIVIVIIGLKTAMPTKEIKTSIRVDLVGLPDITKKQMQQIQPNDFDKLSKSLDRIRDQAEKKATEPPEPKEPVVKTKAPKEVESKPVKTAQKAKPRQTSLKSAIDRIKALEALEDQPSAKKSANRAAIKGNALSQGSSMTGDVTNSADEINAYAEQMRNRLHANWDLPVWLSQQKLSAKVGIFLDRMGNVLHMVIVKSSGNDQFDLYVQKTVRASQPFGPPPKEILEDGVTVGFPL